MEEKYQRIKEIVEKELVGSAQGMDHVMRVYHLSLRLAEGEPDVDLDVLKAAALLHDVARVKEDKDKTGKIDHAVLGAEMAEKILKDLGYAEEKIEQVKHCIMTHRFRSEIPPQTKEGKILFDADKLECVGAVAIARSFIIAGEYGEMIYLDIPIDEYIKENLVGGKKGGRIKDISKHAPNIEYEIKLKHIPERLFTEKAKEMAKERSEFMRSFFERLGKEIKGEL